MQADDTHDTTRRSWVPGADGGDFPLQNLPLGIFSPRGGAPRPGIAIGARCWTCRRPGCCRPCTR